MYYYLFECLSVFSKNYKRCIWIRADNNLEAMGLIGDFDWSGMSRYIIR